MYRIAVRTAVGVLHFQDIGARRIHEIHKRTVRAADRATRRIPPDDGYQLFVRAQQRHFHRRRFADIRVLQVEFRLHLVHNHYRNRIVRVAFDLTAGYVQGNVRRRYYRRDFYFHFRLGQLDRAAVGKDFQPLQCGGSFGRGVATRHQPNRTAETDRIKLRIFNTRTTVENQTDRSAPFTTVLGYRHQRVVIKITRINRRTSTMDDRIINPVAVL